MSKVVIFAFMLIIVNESLKTKIKIKNYFEFYFTLLLIFLCDA